LVFLFFAGGSGYQESAHEGEFSASNPLLCFHPSIADINFCAEFFQLQIGVRLFVWRKTTEGRVGCCELATKGVQPHVFSSEDEMFSLLAKIHME
jgi:hypothetical protein